MTLDVAADRAAYPALGQGRQFRRVLPGELARQACRVRGGGHQPGEPAGGRVIEVLVEVVRHTAQVPGQVASPPLRARPGFACGAATRGKPGDSDAKARLASG